MRLALTGSSSTGKTTLGRAVVADPVLGCRVRSVLNVDARELLKLMGYTGMDSMSVGETRSFQEAYYREKVGLEQSRDHYLAERSFVDVAAYWLERDSIGLSADERDSFVAGCRAEAARYDLHIYLPLGVIPFKPNGHRPLDMDLHERVDTRIRRLLHEWGLRFMEVSAYDLDERVDVVRACVEELVAADRQDADTGP